MGKIKDKCEYCEEPAEFWMSFKSKVFSLCGVCKLELKRLLK